MLVFVVLSGRRLTSTYLPQLGLFLKVLLVAREAGARRLQAASGVLVLGDARRRNMDMVWHGLVVDGFLCGHSASPPSLSDLGMLWRGRRDTRV